MCKQSHPRRVLFLHLLVVSVVIAFFADILLRFTNIASAQSPQDATFVTTNSGFFYPLGKNSWKKTGGTWLGGDSGHDSDGPPAYSTGLYHLGVDMPANEGDPVYAITNGEVWLISGSGWGTGNVAVIVKHTLDTGAEFLAVYGHVRSDIKRGQLVTGGVKFATIGPWPDGDHLHFGIRPNVSNPLVNDNPPIGWGRAANSWWPSTNGFVDPVEWINSRTPKCGNATSQRFKPGGKIPLHPDGSLIKKSDKEAVYVLEDGRKRFIPTPQRLYELYGRGRGFDFRDVITVSDDEFGKYDLGPDVTDPLPILPTDRLREPDGRLIRQRGQQEIAIVSHGLRRPFATWTAFLSLGYLPCNIATVDDYFSYPHQPGDTVEGSMSTSLTDAELADLSPPKLTITSHRDEQHVTTSSIVLSGTATDATRGDKGISTVIVNGQRASGDTASGPETANWNKQINLNGGANSIVVTARDNSTLKNSTTLSYKIFFDSSSPQPSPTPTYKISGRIVNQGGVPQAGVEVVYGGGRRLADGNVQILRLNFTQTDSQGFYVIAPAFGGFTYNLTPTQENGLFFNPRRYSIDNLSRDQVVNFVAKNSPSPGPEIRTEPNSDRAVAMESVSQQGDPFPKAGATNLDPDDRTRVSLFVSNLDLPSEEFLWDRDIFVNAESAVDQIQYGTTLEFVERVADFTFLHQVVIRLPDDPGVIGDYFLRLNFLGSWSNRVRITIFPIGIQFMRFVQGDPKEPGDGIIALANNGFELAEPLGLRGTRNGFTFTTYLPPNSPTVTSMSFNIISQKPPGPCRASFGIGVGSITGRVTLNGTGGIFINVTQSEVEAMVKAANTAFPGCDFTTSDLFVGKIFLNGSSQNNVVPITAIDAISLGRGQNLFSGTPVSSRP